jgi:hypothetical protein
MGRSAAQQALHLPESLERPKSAVTLRPPQVLGVSVLPGDRSHTIEAEAVSSAPLTK